MDGSQKRADEDGKNKAHLAAVCGTFCGACPAYLSKHGSAERTKAETPRGSSSGPVKELKTIPDPSWMAGLLCDGCLSGGELPDHCRNCSMKMCTADKENVSRCSDCDELPCHRILEMIDTGLLHRAEYLSNLGKIRGLGVEEWIKCEEERWRCPQCGLPMSWYDCECVRCGEPRSGRLFPLSTALSFRRLLEHRPIP